jgi:hypothetical protein
MNAPSRISSPKRLAFALAMLALPAAWASGQAGSSGTEAATKAYIYLKQDSSLYVGEGTASAGEFGGDELKAMAAARERAKAALADSVQVHIRSEVAESLKSKDGKVSEEIQSQSKSQADVSLENVKYMELQDYPGKGKATVLASLSKEEYRRQLAGKKVSVYLPENGMRFKIVGDAPWWLHDSGYSPGFDLGLEFIHRSFMGGFEIVQDQLNLGGNQSGGGSSQGGGGGGGGGGGSGGYSGERVSGLLGYNWTPWAMRLQPYVPIRVEYQWINFNDVTAGLFGGSAGIGLRWWANDSLALDCTARYSLGFNQADYRPAGPGSASLWANTTGPQLDVGLLWSGF